MSTIHNEILDVEQQVTRCRTWWVRVGFVPLVGVFLMGAGCPEDPDTQADVRPNTIVNVRAAPEIIVMVPGDRAEVTLDTTTNNTQGRTIPAGIEYAVTIDPAKVATVEDVAMLSVDGSVATDTRPQLANLTIETSNLTEPGIYEFSISVLDLGSGFRIGEHGRLQVVIIPTDGAIRTAKVSKIAAGLTHTLALLDDGSVWGWGHNDFGQLGDGTRVDRSAPVRVVDLDDVPIRSIAAGDNISVALGANGRVYAWGSDERRQLAATQSQASDCSTAFSSIRDLLADRAVVRPITVETDNGCIQAHAIAAGADHILVLTADGVFGFGHNDHGELATEVPGDLDQAQTGKLMKDLPDLPIAIAAAGNSSFALLPGGEVWGWGENIWGQLGVVAGADVMRPRDVGFATNIDLIAPGAGFVIARRRGESGLVSWGANASGQLGNGTKIGRDVPMQTATDLSISQLAAGERHAIATLADGTVYAWGDNQWGQLGVTTVEPSQTTPLAVPLTGINGIAAGAAHSLTRHEACGTLWSFGQNT